MISKIKKYWKENVFFSLVGLKKESKFNMFSSIFWLTCFGIMYTNISYIILLNYFLSLFLDVEKTNKKLYNIFTTISVLLFIAYMIYLIFIV